jgi:hypothetical protein
MTGRVQYTAAGDEFIIADYNNAKAFASFLPAIAGLWGKPLWLYYVNRGQAIANFGVGDKDGAMMEFVAANKAYRLTASQGFRTFYKIDGAFYEPFRNAPDAGSKKITQTMYIKPYLVRLVDRSEEAGIETQVEFCTLPGERFPALLRRLTVKNIAPNERRIECIDGLPMLLPWGTRDWMLKNMSRLAEGWFAGVHFSPNGTPYYKLPVEALDRPEIIPVTGAHFYAGRLEGAGAPGYCIDPDSVFGEQRDFAFPAVFLQAPAPFTVNPNLSGKNKTPSGMGAFSAVLRPGGEAVYCSMAGHCGNAADIDAAAELLERENFFETKARENAGIIQEITKNVYTNSAYSSFDTYCAQNFIDNALRGGLPVNIGKNRTAYYAYSRVHGDMEREYNSFVVLPEYFSQGNGNYRDVNQNRRSDIFFNQNIRDDTIHFFMNLIQSDGFNPLKVLGARFVFETEDARRRFLDDFSHNALNTNGFKIEKLSAFLENPLTIGGLFNFIEDHNIELADRTALLDSLAANAVRQCLAAHGEGYWSDHWHYNTDLIENYLAVFPDRLEELLFGRGDYTFYDDCYFVEPRAVKYVLYRGEPKQFRAISLDREKEALIASRAGAANVMRADFGTGAVYATNLFGKLLSLVAQKYASLDQCGMGLEMETDKPNWCDALNGLPGLFGSSSAESLELLRLVSLLQRLLTHIAPNKAVSVAEETLSMLEELAVITKQASNDFDFWDRTHTVKEQYREKTHLGFSGRDETRPLSALIELLSIFEQKLETSRTKLCAAADDGIVPTYFEFVPTAWKEGGGVSRHGEAVTHGAGSESAAALKALAGEKTTPVIITAFNRKTLPLFLEGAVHFLRLRPEKNTAADFHRAMLTSPLYDKKLRMFKINAPLADAGMNIGRNTVFTPGWLENESIWLHMEYKYLLELLRCDLPEAFFSLAKTALVPFFDARVYGRSVFENSSFLASSAHPEQAIHGQGFVARLSGATAEFISMWIAMTCGLRPFFLRGGELCLELKPALAKDFFTVNGEFSCMFLGKILVVYHNESGKDTFGEDGAMVHSYHITFSGGETMDISGAVISGEAARAVRDGKAERIDVKLGRR